MTLMLPNADLLHLCRPGDGPLLLTVKTRMIAAIATADRGSEYSIIKQQ